MTPAEERAHNRRRAARVWLDRIPDSGGWDLHARRHARALRFALRSPELTIARETIAWLQLVVREGSECEREYAATLLAEVSGRVAP